MIKSNTDYSINPALAVLLVGDPKTGKTCVALSFPDPFILDVDLNLASAVRVAKGKPFKYSQPAIDVGVTIDQTGKTMNAEKVWNAAMSDLKAAAADPTVKTIVIDGLTKLADYAVEHILAEVAKMEGKPIQTLRIQDYGRFMSLYQRLISFLRATNKYIVCTSHQTNSKNEITGAMHYALAIPGQLKDTFGGFFTDTWATSATPMPGNKTKYEIRTRPTGFHVALGTSVRSLDAALDVTDKDPIGVWAILEPKLKPSA